VHIIRFEPSGQQVQVSTGTLLSEAAKLAGLELNMPCGGQGRCGRCAVIAKNGGGIRRRSTVRLSVDDLVAGYALGCQTVVEGDAVITIPPQEKIERRLATDKTALRVTLPFDYHPQQQQPLRLFHVSMEPPDMADQTDDWSRLKRALSMPDLTVDLPTLRQLGPALRAQNWAVTTVIETDTWSQPEGTPRLVALLPVDSPALVGAAVDIGTTTVSLYLVNLQTGKILARSAEYNGQIKRGEDVISRIIFAGKNNGLAELQMLVVETINTLLERAARRADIAPAQIYKMTVAGNSTMLHLFLGLPPTSIRLEPFVTAINQPLPVRATDLGLNIHPQATVDCLPGVAGYVGADISAGVIGSQMCTSAALTLFLDVGTNGEMVMGDCDWLISCACSAGPAFEGAGVRDGMRATIGAIEEVWINHQSYEPVCRVIPNPKLEVQGLPTPPQGLCGSGLISLLAEMFITGVVDKGGNLNFSLNTPRIRQGEHGSEYVVAWAHETIHARDIVITNVDIDNLMRAKGAIYAGFTVLAQSVGVELEMVERVLIGGSFGQYINVEKAVQIGLLPDMAWDRFEFLGNTALQGALLALLNRDYRQRVAEVAARMTYLELSADNSFYDAFVSAMFLPHTDLEQFPSVAKILST
jgi:uncharacterized 2Fe-2S/4Fe-4S cluster protein (DUF4445 family)